MKHSLKPPPAGRFCKLCLNERQLRLSHITPEYTYKAMYDEKHRMYAFKADDPRGYHFEQKGLRSYILCGECERFMNDNFEKPFLAAWQNTRLPGFDPNIPNAYTTVDYATFKLFHLSVLWRASVSDHPAFAAVNLGPYEEKVRQTLLAKYPGPETEHPIMCAFLVDDDGSVAEMFAAPKPFRLFGRRGYTFIFSGCHWVYLIGSHTEPRFKQLQLREDGTLPAGTIPVIEEIRRQMAIARARGSRQGAQLSTSGVGG